MSEQIYFWVGGSTGSTLADRFSWNVPGNWKVFVSYDSYNNYLETTTATDVPSYNDIAVVGGYSPLGGYFSETVTSPLLFGGFSGGLTSGGWTLGGETTGNQWTSALDKFIVAGNELQSRDNTNISGYTFNYPFKYIGGGIPFPGEIRASELKASPVAGMTNSNWDYLFNNRTFAQQQFNIKSNENIFNIDYLRTPAYTNSGTATNNDRFIKAKFVDNYAPGICANQTSIVAFGSGIKLNVSNSKLDYISFEQPIGFFDIADLNNGVWSTKSWNSDTRNDLIISNSVVGTIELFTETPTIIDQSSIIGEFRMDLKHAVNFYGKNFNNGATYQLGGTYDAIIAARALQLTPILTGLTKPNINIDFTGYTFSVAGSRKSPTMIQIGDKNTNTFEPDRYTIKSMRVIGPQGVTKLNTSLDNRPLIRFINYGAVTNLEVYSTRIESTFSSTHPTKGIKIRSLYLKDQSTLNLSKVTTFKNWFFGEINENNFYGGIAFDDPKNFGANGEPLDASEVILNSNVLLIPYGSVGNVNTRTGIAYSSADEIESADSRPRI